jgi:uncharacterized protein (TIGR03067 family)
MFRIAAWSAAFILIVAGCGRQQLPPGPAKVVGKGVERDAPPGDPQATARDLKALQGKWELVSIKRDWVEAKEPPTYYVFEDATMTVYPRDRRESYYTLKLDASKSPKQMDIIATWPDGKVTKAEVIYVLDGDVFRWCHVDGKRPSVFLSEQNPAGTLNVIRRAMEK